MNVLAMKPMRCPDCGKIGLSPAVEGAATCASCAERMVRYVAAMRECTACGTRAETEDVFHACRGCAFTVSEHVPGWYVYRSGDFPVGPFQSALVAAKARL